LSETALKLETAPGPLRSGPVVAQLPSKLFAAMIKQADAERRLTVLEIGTALAETVDFFSRFHCRLHFCDLYSESFVHAQADLSQDELRQGFEAQFRFASGTSFDLCLFWDFLSYLDDPALRAFNSALRPWLHRGTQAHGFGVHHLAISLENIQYGVKDEETLTVRKRQTAQMRAHPHSQIEMHDMLDCFKFERGLLMPDGKLEMLLKSTLANSRP
jgi:hypothetical protein